MPNPAKLVKLWKALQHGKPLSKQDPSGLKAIDRPKIDEPTPKPDEAVETPVDGDVLQPEPQVKAVDEPPVEPPIRDQGAVSPEEAGEIVESVEKAAPEEPVTNINFNRIDTEDDIAAMIDAASKQQEAAGKAPPRDTLAAMEQRSEGYTLKDIVGHDPVKQGIMLPEKAIGARNLLVELGERLFKQAKRIDSNKNAVSDEDLFAFRENIAKYRAVLGVVEGQTRLAGQLLGSFRSVAKNSGMIRDVHMSSLLEDMGGREVAIGLARNISLQNTLKGVTDQAKTSWGTKTLRMVEQFRYNAMLSGPETHMRNFIGNTAALLGKAVETPFVVAAGKARKSVSKTRLVAPSDDAVRLTETVAQFAAIRAGASDGLRLAFKALKDPQFTVGIRKTGNLSERNISLSNSKWAQTNPVAKSLKFLTDVAFMNGATRALNAGDLFFKSMAYQMEKSSLAVRQAMNEGLTGDDFLKRVEKLMKDMPAEHYVKAIDEMHIATFTQDMQGEFFKAMKQGLNRTPGSSAVIPFFGTLVNLTSWTARRSPMAALTPSFYRALREGGIQADKAIGQAVAGTMLVAYPTWENVRQGKLTGSGAFLSEDTKFNWIKAGWRPNSYLDDDGVYHSISGGAPFTTLIMFYATVFEAMGFVEDEKARTDAWMGAAAMFGDVVLDQTFAQSLYETLDAVVEPAKWKSSKWARRFVGSFAPNWMRWVRRVTDSEKRETNLGDFSDRLTAEMMNRIPGLSDSLPPSVQFFGEPPAIGYDALMVFPESASHPDMYLYHHLDRNGYRMRKPKPVMRLAGQDIDLNQDVTDKRGDGYAYYQWQVFLGKARKKMAKAAIDSSVFNKSPEGRAGEGADGRKTRGDILQGAMNKAKKTALKDMMDAYAGTDFAELVRREIAEGTEEVHPVMPHIKRDMESRKGVSF